MLTLPRLLISGLLSVIIVAAAAGAAWWFFIREDNDLKTNAPDIPSDLVAASTSTPSSATSGDALAFVVIPDRSEAAYYVDEKLAALSLPSTAKGTTNDIEGTIYLTKDGVALDTSRPSSFTVDLTTLKSDKDMRDRRVQEQGLETSKYPKATFTITGVSGHDPSLPEGEEQSLKLTGMMDLHGVQKELTWDVKAKRAGNVITALATVKFQFADFNIPVLNIAGFVSVQDAVTLQVSLVAQAS